MIESKKEVLLDSLRKFYQAPQPLRVLTDVLRHHETQSHKTISLRILDWLVTNYAKKQNIVYLVKAGADGTKTFNMFLEYKSQLKAYSKRFFDPFCRRERLEFLDADGRAFETTVGQLNFFRWAILNGVVEYGTRHSHVIEDDMFQSIQHRKKGNKTKRRELSKAAIRGCTRTHVHVTVRFT